MANLERQLPKSLTRRHEERLLDLCASGNVELEDWRKCGSGFFMGGVAILLASSIHFDREKYLNLSEALHAGISTNLRLVQLWLDKSPAQPSRFMNLLKTRMLLG